ncbi:glycoside hydrolase family 43 protein [Tenggerimyces flavus]|uniref:Family 43 glycosylhydrolase n=1 Tax=Tenggerimyces flavus TaxID=1708749 RepID=A0ABV7Y9I6_9ACTN|nr:glycoside hydrolase family 43 protein [Tenggerimyces flavus]MBM7788815.1 GH43 family beta-xylosidase [Tenggerimyces flavus]
MSLSSHSKLRPLAILGALFALLAATFVPLSAEADAPTFTNPIATNRSDPHVIKHAGKYYYTSTDGCVGGWVCVWESTTITGLGSATRHQVWQVPACPAINCAEIWAPEIHVLNGKAYIYYAADNGDNANHRIFVLEATTSSPTGPYAEANTGQPHGKLFEASDRWAIDLNVMQTSSGQLYALWSGWAAGPGPQNLYIAPMSDPLHLSGPRVLISQPDRPWEVVDLQVNEGPVGFQRNGKTYISYSASGCWTDSYSVGLLVNSTGDLLNPAAWVKTGPHFKYNNGVKASASIVPIQTVTGNEDWFVYHANTAGCDPGRVLSAQRLYWDTDGTPLLGYPIANGVQLTAPNGELGSTGSPNPYDQGWGNAFGDLAQGVNDGLRSGSWSIASPTAANVTAPGGAAWTRLFRASNPNYETYTVSVDVQWVATGTTSGFPKYGIYATYEDRDNHVEVFIDRQFNVLATHAVVQGVEQAWQNAPLPAGFDPAAFHQLRVVKNGATYRFLLDGVQLQQRTFPGAFPVLLNGQTGLVTEDTAANYRNWAVTGTF